jgi:hypothetical protein
MRKIATILVCFVLATATVSAVDLSGGGVLGFGMNSYNVKVTAPGVTFEIKETDTLFSGGAFVDATYVMAQLNYTIIMGVNNKVYQNDSLAAEFNPSVHGNMFTLGLFGKYPLQLGSFTLAPLAGFEYTMLLSMKEEGYDVTDSVKDYFNRLWLKAGACADFNVGSMFIRPIATIGYGLENKYDKDAKDAFAGADSVSVTPLKFDFAIAFGKKF